MGCARWLALGGLLALAGLLQARLLTPHQAGFGECDRFFYAGTPPAGLETEAHVRICQRFAGSERFATLYSPGHRIPVFSAFRAARPAPLNAEQRGLLEPQVSRVRPPGKGNGGWETGGTEDPRLRSPTPPPEAACRWESPLKPQGREVSWGDGPPSLWAQTPAVSAWFPG